MRDAKTRDVQKNIIKNLEYIFDMEFTKKQKNFLIKFKSHDYIDGFGYRSLCQKSGAGQR